MPDRWHGALWKRNAVLREGRTALQLTECQKDRVLGPYDIENLRPRCVSASLVFGQIVHQALAVFFRENGNPLKFFVDTWKDANGFDLNYSRSESWEKLNAGGQSLLERFLRDELSRLGEITASEKVFELRITNVDRPLVGIIDLLADVAGKKTVVGFKTSGLS